MSKHFAKIRGFLAEYFGNTAQPEAVVAPAPEPKQEEAPKIEGTLGVYKWTENGPGGCIEKYYTARLLITDAVLYNIAAKRLELSTMNSKERYDALLANGALQHSPSANEPAYVMFNGSNRKYELRHSVYGVLNDISEAGVVHAADQIGVLLEGDEYSFANAQIHREEHYRADELVNGPEGFNDIFYNWENVRPGGIGVVTVASKVQENGSDTPSRVHLGEGGLLALNNQRGALNPDNWTDAHKKVLGFAMPEAAPNS